ncbi:MAG: glycoside hydrolase family 2 TIM barrel-domain containing protein [Bacteroidales bacterium]
MKTLLKLLFVAIIHSLVFPSLFFGKDNSYGTQKVYLSGKGCDDMEEWDFKCSEGMNSGFWTKIGVPSCWEMQGFGYYNYGQDIPKHDEIGYYKTTFIADKSWCGKLIQIVFEGSMTDTEMKINGHLAGPVHQGAFYCFKRDISKYIKFGKKNLVEIKVRKMSTNESINWAERKADFWVFGGIFRPVYLEISPKLRITHTAFDARCDGSLHADIYLNKTLKNISVLIDVLDEDGHVAGRVQAPENSVAEYNDVLSWASCKLHIDGKINGIKPWSNEYPNLYTAVISVKQSGKTIYQMSQKLGFRTIQIIPTDGIYLNGRKIRIKGVNRHCAWPTSGRTTSKKLSIKDVKLIKDMNMNAVRMSHYSPDKHFLDACDSLGLMVLDELTSWSLPAYDTKAGTILANELLRFDVNHPSIIMWDNGNEGGTNPDLDKIFPTFDIQKRKVIHPWGWSADTTINTLHYISYNHGIKSTFQARDIFMPTECLHGLYDGGAGAGLEDFWTHMMDIPNCAGLFIWDFADECIVRTDKGGKVDAETFWAADGILGPYRQKEGSYYTIKNIWSPIQLEPFSMTKDWNGKLLLHNEYVFTNLKDCYIKYSLLKFNSLMVPLTESYSKLETCPNIPAGETRYMDLKLPEDWANCDILKVEVYDYNDHKLSTWTYDIAKPKNIAPKIDLAVPVEVEGDYFVLHTDSLTVKISKLDGMLKEVKKMGCEIAIKNGPKLLYPDSKLLKPEVKVDNENKSVSVTYLSKKNYKGFKTVLYSFTWMLGSNDILKLDYKYQRPSKKPIDFEGITFEYPEKDVSGCRLFARGPYRVYKNRLRGVNLGLWNKKYNDTRTGINWNYPEFKGYYSNFYGMRILGSMPFEVYSASVDIYLHLFTPSSYELPEKYNGRFPSYPDGDLSFLDAIPGIGTKFKTAEELGPEGQKSFARNRFDTYPIHNILYFKF